MAAATAEMLRLRQVGFRDDQVEALDAFMRASVATEADLAKVRVAVAEAEARIIKWMIGALAAQAALDRRGREADPERAVLSPEPARGLSRCPPLPI